MNDHKLTYADAARIAGTGLISAGVALLMFVFVTVTWGDPITGLQNSEQQAGFAKNFAHQLSAFGTDAGAQNVNVGVDCRLTRGAARAYRSSIHDGDVAAKLQIPHIHLLKYVIDGAAAPDLAKGPGLYEEANFPGMCGPVAIAGHRTTHGAPFMNVDQLHPGNKIDITMPYGKFEYTVTKTRIILPNDWSILDPGADQPHNTTKCVGGTCEFLVLTACHPKYSASHRIAVFAHLTKVELTSTAARADATA